MDRYRVTLFERDCYESTAFDCEAEGFGHAEEQAADAYKGCDVTEVRRLAKRNGRTLGFTHAGTAYECSLEPETLGHVTRYGDRRFPLPHPTWRIKGFSKHHLQTRATVPLSPDMDAESAVGGYVWDVDHGTTRAWGGSYNGRTPRVTRASLGREGTG